MVRDATSATIIRLIINNKKHNIHYTYNNAGKDKKKLQKESFFEKKRIGKVHFLLRRNELRTYKMPTAFQRLRRFRLWG